MKAHFTFFFLFAAGVIFSQESGISGKVKDLVTNESLPGAIVTIGSLSSVSDFNGDFYFELKPGGYTISCSYVGYEKYQSEVFISEGQQASIIILMNTADQVLSLTTVTSTRYQKPLGESIVSLEVIRPYLIQNTNTTAVDQVLLKMPGVDIIDGQANIRGGSGFSYGAGTRVLLLLDDIPALQADAGYPNWNDFPVENIAQIEVLKGASSVLYGSSALNGIINIRTGYATDKPETKISTFYTHYFSPMDSNKKWWDNTNFPYETGLSFLHKQKFGKLDLVGGGFIRRNESFNKDTYDRYYRASINLRYRFNDRLVVGTHAIVNPGSGASFFYWQNPEAGALQGDPDAFNISRRFRMYVDPYVNYYDKSGGRHRLISRYYYVNNDNNENRSNISTLYYGEYQYTKQFRRYGLNISSGLVGQGTTVNAELYGDTTYTSLNYAAYFQVDKKFWNRLTLAAGMRYEYNEMRSPERVLDFEIPGGVTREQRPVYRVGLNYQLREYTFFRASYGQGYRYPTVAERFINTPFGSVAVLPNPGLVSEIGWSSEIGFKQGLKIGNWQGFFDAAAFVQEYNDMMEFVFTFLSGVGFGFQSNNVGDTRIKGLDFNISGSGNIGKYNTSVLMGYTYVDPRYKNFTEQDSLSSSAKKNILKYRFQHTFKLDIESGRGPFNLGASVLYYSFMENIDAILEEIVVPGLKQYRSDNAKGFTIVDLRASYQINRKLKGLIIMKNILNKEYSIRPGILDAPRNLTFRLEVDL